MLFSKAGFEKLDQSFEVEDVRSNVACVERVPKAK
jgi:hypothetical protein